MANRTGTHKTSKSEQTRMHIIKSYLGLIPGKQWDKISVIEICRAANITRGTFYQYFSDIYDLMEQVETTLIEDLRSRYIRVPNDITPCPLEKFEEKFDYRPPKVFLVWFDFCKDHKDAMVALLDHNNGDSYFVIKLKNLIRERLDFMMDSDGMAHDDLRNHFIKTLTEIHFLAAQTWLEEGEDNFLSTEEIVNLLNTVRVGSVYLSYKRATDPDFKTKMNED